MSEYVLLWPMMWPAQAMNSAYIAWIYHSMRVCVGASVGERTQSHHINMSMWALNSACFTVEHKPLTLTGRGLQADSVYQSASCNSVCFPLCFTYHCDVGQHTAITVTLSRGLDHDYCAATAESTVPNPCTP